MCGCCRTPIRVRTRRSTKCSTRSTTGAVNLGVVPIENSIGGSIHRNYDLLRRARTVDRRRSRRCRSCTTCWRCPASTLGEVRRVLSHPQALAQCARFLRGARAASRRLPPTTRPAARRWCATSSGATRGDCLGAGRRCSSGSRRSRRRHPGLRRQHHALPGDRPRSACRSAARQDQSLVFTLQNGPGALFKALSVFALRDIDLSKLESRPVPGRPWEYLFYARRRGRARGSAVRARDGAPGRVRALASNAGLVSALARPRGRSRHGAAADEGVQRG